MTPRRTAALAGSAALLATLARPGTAAAEIVWRGDFETADLSQWNETTGPVGERVTFVQDPVREGMYAARMEIRPGDLGNGDLNRVEYGYHPPAAGFEGSERWYAWSAMQDAAFPLGASWHAFTYWEAEVLYTAALTFRLYAGNEMTFCSYVGGEQVHWTRTFEPGMWHDFVLHVVWSADASEGLVELWYDGELVVPATHVATMFTLPGGEATPNFLHQGMIRDELLEQTEVFFYDGVVEATAPEDVMPGASDTSGGATEGDSGDETSDGGEADAGDASGSASDASAASTTSASDTGQGEGTSAADDGTSMEGAPADADGGGCSCRQSSAGSSWVGLLGWLAFVARGRRRRLGSTHVPS
ncbi:MAG: heparin lyase I family protein [Deltaproteobacteria bacterium]|nr:heparin lyase I family protein [Nannocystaceae bacterium]